MQSSLFKNNNIVVDDNTIAIHIRNGDYIDDKNIDVFDRIKYMQKCFSCISHKIKNLVVFSDDNTLNKQLYNNLFKQYFVSVTYIENKFDYQDFVAFSAFKYKILWNSTFSYWAAFIGNVLYKNTYNKIYAPAKFNLYSPLGDHCNPLWNIIDENAEY